MSNRVIYNNMNPHILVVDQWLDEFNDQWANQLGQPSGTRRMVLQGTTEITQWVSPNIFDVQGQMKRALEADGFSVVSVRMANPNWTGYKQNFEIELNVYPNYTAEQIRQRAIQIIEGITRSFGTSIKVFYNTQLRVTLDGSNGSAYQPNYDTNFPSNYNDGTDDNPYNFWNAFGGSLGLSAPVALVGGALLLILLLKR